MPTPPRHCRSELPDVPRHCQSAELAEVPNCRTVEGATPLPTCRKCRTAAPCGTMSPASAGTAAARAAAHGVDASSRIRRLPRSKLSDTQRDRRSVPRGGSGEPDGAARKAHALPAVVPRAPPQPQPAPQCGRHEPPPTGSRRSLVRRLSDWEVFATSDKSRLVNGESRWH
jgi:hypothetical protein